MALPRRNLAVVILSSVALAVSCLAGEQRDERGAASVPAVDEVEAYCAGLLEGIAEVRAAVLEEPEGVELPAKYHNVDFGFCVERMGPRGDLEPLVGNQSLWDFGDVTPEEAFCTAQAGVWFDTALGAELRATLGEEAAFTSLANHCYETHFRYWEPEEYEILRDGVCWYEERIGPIESDSYLRSCEDVMDS